MALHPKKQRKLWIWTAVSLRTGRLLAFAMGSRGAKTAQALWRQITKSGVKLFAAFTNRWKICRKVIPENLLCQSRKLTPAAETQNTRIRHYLARFHRKTLCCSKSPAMVELSLWLFPDKLC
ncbi:MAG: IS1 family transposase [Pseudomonadota bacterium]|nr:IS1 family transposase [Pseudomonadota bacterium]